MSGCGISSALSASGSKRSRSPDTLEEAWRLRCKYSVAGSRRAACKYAGGRYMLEKLRDFAEGGRYYKADPSLKPMSGGEFEAWQAEWEQRRREKAASEARRTYGGAPRAREEEEEAAEGEDPDYLQAVADSLKEAEEKARAEKEEEAATIAAVKEMEEKEEEAQAEVVVLDD